MLPYLYLIDVNCYLIVVSFCLHRNMMNIVFCAPFGRGRVKERQRERERELI